MTMKELASLDIHDEVYWEDPDEGLSSGKYRVMEIVTENGRITDMDDMLVIANEAGSVAEVFAAELR